MYFEDFLKKFTDILKRLDAERINSVFGTPLKDFKFGCLFFIALKS